MPCRIKRQDRHIGIAEQFDTSPLPLLKRRQRERCRRVGPITGLNGGKDLRQPMIWIVETVVPRQYEEAIP